MRKTFIDANYFNKNKKVKLILKIKLSKTPKIGN